MTLGQDWAFNEDHTDLDETGRLATGPRTLADWAVTVALTSPTGLPEDPAFGAGLAERIARGLTPGRDVGERLRGLLFDDERVADVDASATTAVGQLVLPIRIEASTEHERWNGPLDDEMIERIIAEHEEDTQGEVLS